MVELVGDPCLPNVFVLPPNINQAMSGAVFMSGLKIWFYQGSEYELVTSA